MFGKKTECAVCHTSETNLWKKVGSDILCNDCTHNKTTCLPRHGQSRSSSPDASLDSSSNSQQKSKLQKLDSDQVDISIKKDSCKETSKSSKDGVQDTSECDKESSANTFSGVKNRGNKEKTRKDEAADDDNKRDTRRKTRKGKLGSKGSVPKGKGRRYIFKKSATKAPVAVTTPITSESLMYKGQYWQIGDIVSVLDVEGGRYYCQVRGLLQDQYCEKSAVLTWLLPTTHSPPPNERFDPATYIIGPEEELPRKLEYLDFVCHAPSDYYKLSNAPYPTAPSTLSNAGYVWAKLGPVHTGSLVTA